MWRPFFEKYHMIIIQDGDPSRTVKVPEGCVLTSCTGFAAGQLNLSTSCTRRPTVSQISAVLCAGLTTRSTTETTLRRLSATKPGASASKTVHADVSATPCQRKSTFTPLTMTALSPRTPVARTSTRSSSTSQTCLHPQHPSFSTPCMTHTLLAPISYGATHSACGKELQQLFHMVIMSSMMQIKRLHILSAVRYNFVKFLCRALAEHPRL